MKKNFWILALLIILILIILWGVSPLLIGYLICVYKNKFNLELTTTDVSGIYASTGVLFTAFAFLGTIITILIQQKNILRQTSYDAIKNVLNKVQREEDYTESYEYIINVLPKVIYNLRMIETKIGTTEIKKRDPDGYSKILYFCRSMEHIGIVSKNNYVDEKILIQYLGKTIIETFNILFPILMVDIKRLGEDSAFYFIHYRHLYHIATNKRNKYRKMNIQSSKKIRIAELKAIEQMGEYEIDFDNIVIFNYKDNNIKEDIETIITENCYCDSCDSCDR